MENSVLPHDLVRYHNISINKWFRWKNVRWTYFKQILKLGNTKISNLMASYIPHNINRC